MLVVFVLVIQFFPLHVKLAQLVHVVDHLVADFDSFSGLFEGVFVSVDLGENSAVLQFQLSNYVHFPHPVGNAFLFEVYQRYGQVLEGVFNALGAFLQQLHLLVAQSHVVKHYEQVVNVSFAICEIYSIHNPVGLLQ